MTGIIDEQGFRLNVGIILIGDDGRVFWGRRIGNRDAWQFPQGGLLPGETPEQALYRELEEEVGLTESDVQVLASTQGWLSYRLPRRFWRRPEDALGRQCIGQRQKWFLLRLMSDEERIDLARSGTPEFQAWRWVNYWYPIRKVVHFKRGVYARALKELAPVVQRQASLKL
ncbi:RNA pyrophosphohydrolase [Alcanivorax quisquiliarum]|uniref:RNA pyrophosphohydrolase n=1 Tax=Alcanivorax quisquiliarum TaxID=2933565 RepID=A0ABT0E5Y5_9GAMM|nr:RNA pyrophosphohydrolase [Alcanivorax quisquiliarum]MCK0537089.1 RNA pyrophosphohydrolase [Alcanivorax quisquiliarum]